MFQKFLRGYELLDCGTKIDSDLILLSGMSLEENIKENNITLFVSKRYHKSQKKIYEKQFDNEKEVLYFHHLFSNGYSAFIQDTSDTIAVCTDDESVLHFFNTNGHTTKDYGSNIEAKNEYQKLTGVKHLSHSFYFY